MIISEASMVTTEQSAEKLKQLRRLAFLLDNSITVPGTELRFGLDPLLGLLGIAAGSGDVVGGAIGTYIISQAAQMGVPNKVVWQMLGNILIDSLIGLVPGLGDLLDFAWKANTRNMALLDQHFQTAPPTGKSNPLFVLGMTLLAVAIVIGCAALTVLLIKTILRL